MMIEFNGMLSDDAQKYFIRKLGEADRNMLIFGVICFLPVIIWTVYTYPGWLPIVAYCLVVAMIPVIPHLPRSAKEIENTIPHKISVFEDEIVCVTKKGIETRCLEFVREVTDYGEFYDISFQFGHYSNLFVCQKELISEGTLYDFELLFKEKLIKK